MTKRLKILLLIIFFIGSVTFVLITVNMSNNIEVANDSFKFADTTRFVEWRNILNRVSFKGKVEDVENYDFTHRDLMSIKLSNVEIINEDSIPIDCKYLIYNYNKKSLDFVACWSNVKQSPRYELEDDDIIEKKFNSDTIFVFDSNKSPKYIFRLFDGIMNNWQPREWPGVVYVNP